MWVKPYWCWCLSRCETESFFLSVARWNYREFWKFQNYAILWIELERAPPMEMEWKYHRRSGANINITCMHISYLDYLNATFTIFTQNTLDMSVTFVCRDPKRFDWLPEILSTICRSFSTMCTARSHTTSNTPIRMMRATVSMHLSMNCLVTMHIWKLMPSPPTKAKNFSRWVSQITNKQNEIRIILNFLYSRI